MASIHEETGSLSDALDEFGKIPLSSDFFVPARIHMGLIMKQQGRLQEAIEFVSATIVKRNNETELYDFLASLYEGKKQYDRAIETLKEGLKTIPDSIDLHYKLGVMYEKIGRFDESVAVMKKIMAMEPDNAEAMNFIGYSFADRGINLDEAESLIVKALELKPGNGYITDSLGWLYFKQNKISQAITLLEKATALLPNDPTIAEHLGDAYAKGGFIKKALAIYNKVLKGYPENTAVKKKIEALMKMTP